jgi:HK97 family phage major capsid protein
MTTETDTLATVAQSLRTIEERTSAVDDLARRVDQIETRAARPGGDAGGTGGQMSREQREHAAAFTAFLRAPKSHEARAALAEIERRAASGASDAAGGFAIPEVILGPLMKRASAANPFRGLVRVVRVDTRDVSFPLSNADMATGWVGELGTRAATAEPTLSAPKPTFGTLYSYVEASEELVMDSQFDVASWFSMEAGDAMGEAEAVAIVSGDGANKPSGLLRVAPAAGADGTRAAGSLRYLPSGVADGLGTGQALADKLIDMVYDLKAQYRARGTWLMNSALAGTVRKLKDVEGRFLWADSLAAGQPATLLGYPVAISEAMPGAAANACPIAFGDFDRAYVLCENGGLRITVDDNITTPGRVKWYIRRRLGGIVYDNDAVRVLKVATT